MRFVSTSFLQLLLAVWAAGPSVAEPIELPVEWPLGIDSELRLELAAAEIHLTSRARELPVLRARAVKKAESAGLDISSSGGSLTVRRAGGRGKGKAPRLRIDVTLGPGRKVSIEGSDLGITVDDDLPENAGRSSYLLKLKESTADLFGARVSRIEAIASGIGLDGTEGDLALDLTGGSAQLRAHRGRLELVAASAEAGVAEHQGNIESSLEGGNLEIAGGQGSFSGTASGSYLSFDAWQGPVEVRAAQTRVEVRDVEHRDRWRIEGRELEVAVERMAGRVEAVLDGGGLRGSDLRGGLQITAGGARIDLVEASGGVSLALVDDADAVLASIRGSVEAEVTDSRIEVDRVERLKLAGGSAEVSVRRVARLEPLEINDSQLTLDLREVVQQPALDLGGSGYARVQLRAPCIVQLSESDPSLGNQVEVTECELRTADQVVSPQQDRAMYGDVRPVRLMVEVGPDAVLEVEGE